MNLGIRGNWRWALAAAFVALLIPFPFVKAADAPALELVQTIDLKGKAGKLDHVLVDGKRGRLLVANKANNTLDIVDLKAGTLLKQVAGQKGVQGIAVADDLDRVFVTLGAGGFCNVFDAQNYKLVKSVKFQDDADNVRYYPATHLVYVTHAEKALGVIDGRTYEVQADLKLGGDAEAFQLESNRARLYVNVPSANQVAVIDTAKNEITTRYPLKLAGDNAALALDEANHRLLIGCHKSPLLVVMDSETGKELSSAPIAGEVDDLFFDAKRKRVYASCGEGSLVVLRQVDADHCEPLAKIDSPKGSRTCFFDPQSSRLYLAVPRQEGKAGPEIRVYQAKP